MCIYLGTRGVSWEQNIYECSWYSKNTRAKLRFAMSRFGAEGVGSEAWGSECLIRFGLPKLQVHKQNSKHGVWPVTWRKGMTCLRVARVVERLLFAMEFVKEKGWDGDLSQWRCLARFVLLYAQRIVTFTVWFCITVYALKLVIIFNRAYNTIIQLNFDIR